MDSMEEATRGPEHTRVFGYSVVGHDPITLAIRGEVDVATAPELSRVLEDLTLFNRNLVLDLGAVEFMDSSGLHALQKTAVALLKVGGEVHISAASDRVRRLFELSGYDKLLPLPPKIDGGAR